MENIELFAPTLEERVARLEAIVERMFGNVEEEKVDDLERRHRLIDQYLADVYGDDGGRIAGNQCAHVAGAFYVWVNDNGEELEPSKGTSSMLTRAIKRKYGIASTHGRFEKTGA